MTVRKRIIAKGRVRKPPKEGWSWIDRRFRKEHASSLSRDAILLYFFLAAVSDKAGLSYYSQTTIAARLRIEEVALVRARDELEIRDLVAYEPPLYQVLSIRESVPRKRNSTPTVIGEILAELAEGRPKMTRSPRQGP